VNNGRNNSGRGWPDQLVTFNHLRDV